MELNDQIRAQILSKKNSMRDAILERFGHDPRSKQEIRDFEVQEAFDKAFTNFSKFKPGLVQKIVIDKNGDTRKIWVRPEDLTKREEPDGERKEDDEGRYKKPNAKKRGKSNRQKQTEKVETSQDKQSVNSNDEDFCSKIFRQNAEQKTKKR